VIAMNRWADRRGTAVAVTTAAAPAQGAAALERLLPVRLPVRDVAVAALLLALAVGTTVEAHLGEGPAWLTLPVAVVMTGATAWRTRAPLTSLVIILAAGLVQSFVGHEPGALWALAVYLLATYSVAAGTTEGRAVIGGTAMVGVQWWQEWQESGSDYLFVVLVFGGAWLLGRFVHQWRGRATLAELNQEERARLAVAEERARIARELHDIVAHGVSVIAVQADAAEAVLARDPARAREPLNVIRASSRDVLDEMRRLLQLLRMVEPQASEVDAGRPGDGVTPQPGLEQLTDLVGSMRAAGLPVSLDAPEQFEPVPSSVALSAYRIVQEALTNVLKHSGRVPTTVQVRRTESALLVDVENDAGAPGRPATSTGSGHGLVGMRERVALVAGELRVGGSPDGGFEVHAVLPVDAHARTAT
jgi:signal transduction histidine kinase